MSVKLLKNSASAVDRQKYLELLQSKQADESFDIYGGTVVQQPSKGQAEENADKKKVRLEETPLDVGVVQKMYNLGYYVDAIGSESLPNQITALNFKFLETTGEPLLIQRKTTVVKQASKDSLTVDLNCAHTPIRQIYTFADQDDLDIVRRQTVHEAAEVANKNLNKSLEYEYSSLSSAEASMGLKMRTSIQILRK